MKKLSTLQREFINQFRSSNNIVELIELFNYWEQFVWLSSRKWTNSKKIDGKFTKGKYINCSDSRLFNMYNEYFPLLVKYIAQINHKRIHDVRSEKENLSRYLKINSRKLKL